MSSKVRRHKGKGRLRIFAVIGLLAAAFGTTMYFDLDAYMPDLAAHASPAALSTTPLPLPGASERAISGTAPSEQASIESNPIGNSVPDTVTSAATAGIAPAIQPPIQADSDPEPSLLATLDTEMPASQGAPSQLPVPVASQPDEDIASEPASDGDRLQLGLKATPSQPEALPQWKEHQVAKGESLARIFNLQGLDAKLLHGIINSSEEAKSLAQLRPGQKIRFQFDENQELSGLELHRNRVESIRVAITDDEISVEEVSKAVEKRAASAAGLIESSLFADGQKAGLSDGLIMQLAAIFGWDIDFALEIRAGDQFRVIYEEQYLDGEKLRNGPILAAEFTNRGTTYTAVRFEDSNGEIGYFDADGHSKRRAFIRTPIKFARVSSRYNPKRWHPVLKKWRSHKGVDYAAPKGTPIKATGDGRVVFRGTKGGYGRTVIVEHAGKYTTLYAHMSKYSKRAKTGTRVKQGQVIGYVGKSGLASGHHLHYEFRVHGKHRDPLRVKLPKSLSLPKSEIARFRETAAPLLTQLAAISAETMVASAGSTGTH